jgi:protein phosphatase
MQFQAAARTDTGRVREHNEDNMLAEPGVGLFAVADGMGGQLAGEVASRIAVENLKGYFEHAPEEAHALELLADDLSPEAKRLETGIRLVNRAIFEEGQKNPACRNMGTTIVAALVNGDKMVVAHVGDSRCYLIRGGTITQLTADHSLVAEQQRQGLISREEAAVSRMKNVITRALGAFQDVKVDLSEHLLISGDRIILCSDGLTNMVTDAEILSVTTKASSLDKACATLIEGANHRGGRDNITVVIVAVEQD